MTPTKGSNRVKGWIWGAINPFIDELERVLGFLVNRNLTWRHGSRKPEYIHEPEAHLDRNGRLILEDLKRYDENLKDKLERYRVNYRSAVEAAEALFARLVQSREFHAQVEAARGEYEAAEPGKKLRDLFDGDASNLIAERLVNRLEAVSPNYTDAPFWNQATYREHFNMFRSWPEAERVRETIDGISVACHELVMYLDDLRTRLCEEYDVSPAPYAGAT